MKPTFEKSVAILELAFLHGVLEPSSCAACACGNLVAGYNGFKVTNQGGGVPYIHPWINAENEVVDYGFVRSWFMLVNGSNRSMTEAQTAGYSKRELTKIERAFMSIYNYENKLVKTKKQLDFEALMEVIDTLAVIHNVDLSVKEKTKLEFAQAA